MKIIDISWPITPQTTGYKNRKNINFVPTRTFEDDGWRESNITVEAHTGTHVDAPAHFMRDGVNIDAIGLEQLCGPAVVLDLTHVQEKITAQDLQQFDTMIKENQIVLLKTTNSNVGPEDPFIANFVYLELSGAHYLAEKKVKAVGIDYLGIERAQSDHATHLILMHNNIAIIEGLRLAHVVSQLYTFICLPLAEWALKHHQRAPY